MDITWNGSYLGVFDATIIKQRYYCNGNWFWDLADGTRCLIRLCKNTQACLIDELKPIFGLDKIGTHTITVGVKLYLLMRSPPPNQKIIHLNEIPFVNEQLVNGVRGIFAFRYLLQANKTNEKCIAIFANENNEIYPLDFDDDIIGKNYKKRGTLSKSLYKKWFEDYKEKISSTLVSLLNLEGKDHSKEYGDLRKKIENVFVRIDPENISMVNIITKRLGAMIDEGMKPE